jgi:hypothetical protein
MASSKASAAEIYKKLRDDFARRLKDYGVSSEVTDPMLAVVFRTIAGQLEAHYSEFDRRQASLLDELIAGLGIEGRRARPAQTILRFFGDGGAQMVKAGTELLGQTHTGERITFATDVSVQVSCAGICLGATYQDGLLQMMSSIELPDSFQSRSSLDPVHVNLGPNPAIFLAIDNLEAGHLSQHGFFFELSPDAALLHAAMLDETWCLAGTKGEFGSAGILRPHRGNAGVRLLEWLVPEPSSNSDQKHNMEVATLPDGFYAGRVFVFPVVPSSRRFTGGIPRAMEGALTKMLGQSAMQLNARNCAWLRISMPREIRNLHTAITGISLHAVSASNVECANETVYFETHGTSIPVSREAGTSHHLVAPLSISGERDTAYLPELAPSSDLGAGRYTIRNGCIHLRPARHADGHVDSSVNLRLWVTRGSVGNQIGAGQIHSFLKKTGLHAMRVSSVTSATGGTDGESLQETQARFAEALLSRDRVVTRADLLGTIRAFDRRIQVVDISSGVERTSQGLQRVQQVRLAVANDDFVEPDQELRLLLNELKSHLEERLLYDTRLKIMLDRK